MDDVGEPLLGLFFEQNLADELLFAGAKEFGFNEWVAFVECGEIHLQLRRGRRSVDDQFAFLLGAGDELLLSLSALLPTQQRLRIKSVLTE